MQEKNGNGPSKIPGTCNPTDAACKNHDLCFNAPATKDTPCVCNEILINELIAAGLDSAPNSPPGQPGLCGIEGFDWHLEAKVLASPFCAFSARATPPGACTYQLTTDLYCLSILPEVEKFFFDYATGNL